jgi:hypothetical protein
MTRKARVFLLLLLVSTGLLTPGLASPALAAAKPVITKVATTSGPLRQTTVVLRGRNLKGVKAVLFGSRAGVVVGRSTATSVTVRTPRKAVAGTVYVRVRTAAGWSAKSRSSRFTFVAAPALSRVSPAAGTFAGGTLVTFTGRNLTTTSKVLFGTLTGAVVSRKPAALVVRTPIGVLGAVRVTVTTVGGTAQATYTYTKPVERSSVSLTAASGTFEPAAVDWVTGGYNEDTAAVDPWLVSLPKGADVPAVGQQLLIRPNTAAFPAGLAGTVTTVADQLDQTVQVTVAPTDLEAAVSSLKLDYSGSVGNPDGVGANSVDVGPVVKFPVTPTALFCEDNAGQSVSFGAQLTTSVSDVDVDQHLNLGNLVHKPTYDGAFSAEIQTVGKISVNAAATCKIKPAWANAQRKTIPLGTSGATLSFGPAFEIKISAKGTWNIEDRTRTTFAVNAKLGSRPTFSRTSRSVFSKQSGELSFKAEVTGGVSVQIGMFDRGGLQGKVQLGVSAAVKATPPDVCVEGEVFAKFTVGVFFDLWAKRWEANGLEATLSILKVSGCTRSTPPAATGEPAITSARLPDATIGTAYSVGLTTADGRDGTWTLVRNPLPAGLTLAPDGTISGTPQDRVADYPVIVDFKDADDRVATTTVRIQVRPRTSLGGGDIQATLRWSGAADLDLHVLDPSGEEIYFRNPSGTSGGRLDHDANADCNGAEDDDNPVENIYWPTGGAPGGSYTVWVAVYKTCDAPVDWHLTVRRDGVVIVDQDGSGDSQAYTFDVGSVSTTGVTARPAAGAGVRAGTPPVRTRESK